MPGPNSRHNVSQGYEVPLSYRGDRRNVNTSVLNYFNHVPYNGFVFVSVWCPCMAVNVSVQHNGGFFPGIILLAECYYHEEVLFLQPMIPPKRFAIFFSLTQRCSGLDAFRFFL